MDTDTKQVELKDLDIFSLIRLDHLSAEEKAQRIAEMQEIALVQFFQDDIPQLLDPQDLQTFEEMAKDVSKSEEVESFLRSKVPELDQLIVNKMLITKKEIIRQNMLTRLEVNNKESSEEEAQNNSDRMQELNREKKTLEDIISAIDEDNWGLVLQMTSSL